MLDSHPKNLGSAVNAFAFVSERGVLSSIYLGSLAFGLILGTGDSTIASQSCLWIVVSCLALGLVISNLTYELMIELFHRISRPMVLRGFMAATGDVQPLWDYGEVQKFRGNLLASDVPEHFKESIRKDLRIRQMLTFFCTSSVPAFAMLLLVSLLKIKVSHTVITSEWCIVVYVFIASMVGEISRSYTLGRTIGFAYLRFPNGAGLTDGAQPSRESSCPREHN